jgi:hypothetical protein
MRSVFLLAAALAGVASLALVQAKAQTPAPKQTMQQCLAKCASCPARADGTIDPACAMKQQNCKTDCESQ